jgi:hypothetical protein
MERITITRILQTPDSRQGPVVGTCEHDNEPLDFTKVGHFLTSSNFKPS